MSKKYTRLSYAERIMNPDIQPDHKVRSISMNILSKIQCVHEKLKRIFFKTELKPLDNKSQMSKYRVSDFSIENLSAIGKLDSLTPVKLAGDKFTAIANMEKQLSSMSKKSKSE